MAQAQTKATRARYPMLALGMLALLAAMWGGLIRIGWILPPIAPVIAGIHGPLMVSGFLGTVISLERAVALRVRWAFAAPLLSAIGTLVLLSGLSPIGGALLETLASVGMIAIFSVIVRRQPALFTYTMALGAILWFAGNVVWLMGLPISTVVLGWTAFLVLTIVGERLELARLRRLSRLAETLFFFALAVLILGIIVDIVEEAVVPSAGLGIGSRVGGIGMIALALWLFRNDIARRTVLQTGLTRFIALCLLAGYVWLGIGGLLRLGGIATGGPYYDAMLHAVFLGFVMSMIFGHAPIILPAVLGRPLAYHPAFYAHLALLHLSLVIRLTGDLVAGLSVRQWGGMLNAIAITLFLVVTAWAGKKGYVVK